MKSPSLLLRSVEPLSVPPVTPSFAPDVLERTEQTNQSLQPPVRRAGAALGVLFAVLFACPVGAQIRPPTDDLDSLGLDRLLLHETGHFTNTRDGYTVVQGPDERWYYATVNEFGNIVPTDVPAVAVGKRSPAELAFLSHAPQHLETEPAIQESLQRDAEEREMAIAKANEMVLSKGLTTGVRQILVLAIEFPDSRAPVGIGYVDSMMNVNTFDPESKTGGFRDYFVKNSYGRFVPESHVYGWFVAKHSLSFYRDTLDASTSSHRLALEALTLADAAGVDLSIFDWDNDGYAEAVVIFTSAPTTVSHFTSLPDDPEFQGITFSPYTIQDLHLGHTVHEYGHALGLRDLYEPPSPFGYYDVMASADWADDPGDFSAYSKILLGWIDPLVIDKPVAGLQIPNSHDHPFAVVIDDRKDTKCCYFVIENRLQKDYDSGGPGTISGSGLLIYHIHRYSVPWSHVEQADGRGDLEAYYTTGKQEGNFGDAGDFFPGTTGNTRFEADTNPSSRPASGAETGISVTNISAPGDVMTIDVGFPVPLGAEVERVDPDRFVLHSNYPNPFSESTTIPYDLPRATRVTLKVFDSTGREVATLESGLKPAGSYHIRFDAHSLPPGAYLCRLMAGDQSATRRLLLVK